MSTRNAVMKFIVPTVCLMFSASALATVPLYKASNLAEAQALTRADGTKGGECPGVSCSYVLQKIRAQNSERGYTDGSLEIIVAILFSQNIHFGRGGGPVPVDFRLSYDEATDFFSTNIPDAGEKTFRQLGVWRDLNMSLFKQNLEMLLPEIKEDIQQIPANPDLATGKIAEYIQLCLQSNRS